MTGQVEGALSRRATWVAAGAICAFAFAAFMVGSGDPDTFHHLAYGRAVLRHGLPREDPLLYPLAGLHTGPMPYWLASAVIYATQALLGEAGPVLLCGALGAALLAVLLLDALGDRPLGAWDLAAALGPLLAVVSSLRPRAYPRPELFANVFVALTLLAVRRHAEGRSRLLLWFPLLAVVWANLHPSLPAGLAAIAIYLAVGAAQLAWGRLTGRTLPETPTAARLGQAAAALAGGALAGLATPSPLNPIRTGVQFVLAALGLSGASPAAAGAEMAMPLLRHLVAEMQPMQRGDWADPGGLLLVAAAASFAVAWRRARPREAVTLLAFAILARSTVRFLPLAAVVAAPILARNAAAGLRHLCTSRPPWGRRLQGAAAGALLLLGAASFPANQEARRSGIPLAPTLGYGSGGGFSPRRAAEYLERVGFRSRLFNTFHFGGYLSWRLGIPVFQDGRALLRRGDAEAALAGPANLGWAHFEPLDRRYRFDALVVDYPLPDDAGAPPGGADGLVAPREEWALVAFDDAGMLYLRRDGPLAHLAARDAYSHLEPALPLAIEPVVAPGKRDAYLAELRRSVEEAPTCVRCRIRLARAHSRSGLPREAIRVLSEASPTTPPQRHLLLLDLADVLAAAGDAPGAERTLRQAVALGVDPRRPRRALAELAAAAGNLEEAWRWIEPSLAGSPGADELMLAAFLAAGRGDPRAGELSRRYDAAARRDAARGRAEEGLALRGLGRLGEAAFVVEQASRLDPADAWILANLGQVQSELGRPGDATTSFRRALAIDPSTADAHLGLARLAIAGGDRQAAASELRAFLHLVPRGYASFKAEQLLAEVESR